MAAQIDGESVLMARKLDFIEIRIPSANKFPGKRAAWLSAINRQGYDPKPGDCVCGVHFLRGKPSDDPSHPDYKPQLFSFSKNTKQGLEKHLKRHLRAKSRADISNNSEADLRLSAAHGLLELNIKSCNELHQCDNAVTPPEQIAGNSREGEVNENTSREVQILNDEIKALRGEVSRLRNELSSVTFGSASIENDDGKTNFYTGLQKYLLFSIVFTFISPFIKKSVTKLSLKDELFIFLVKLRLNLPFEDIAYRCGISRMTVSRIFYKWLDAMSVKLKFLIYWPSSESLRSTLPNMFKKHFPRACCIIDCTEVFIDRPTLLKSRAQTWSNYKKHNTMKVLVAITPTGSISFISKAFGGRMSDREIVLKSDFLSRLENNDQVLADRGFTNEEDFVIRGATLVIPAFTRGKKQLPSKDVEESRQLASVRIEVERCIGLLKSKFHILKGPLPLNLVKRVDDVDSATADKILLVCAALTNLSESIVNKDKVC